MHAAELPEDLERLAQVAGLVPRYTSDQGQPMSSGPEQVRATLELLGVDLTGGYDAARAALEAEREARPVDPVVVAWDGVLPHVPVRAPGGRHGELWLELEDGQVLDPPTAWSSALPLGEHRLVAEGPDWRAEAVVLAAPTVPHGPAPRRRFGVFLPLHALRTSRTRGVADLADLEALFDWADRRGAAAVVTLPLLASWLDDPVEASPYSPVSRRAWNELHLDLDRLLPGGLPEAPAPSEEGHLDHRALWAWKRPLLAEAAERGLGDGLPPEFVDWVRRHPTALAYAEFRGAVARHGRDWRRWPAPLRQGTLPSDEVDPVEARLHLFAQWAMDGQLGALARRVEARGQLLALDLAVGSNPDGFDVWQQQDLFVTGASVGAPPDFLFSGGQDWGFPPVHPGRSQESGHRFLRDCLRHHLRHAGLLRLDHVMGLHRLFWVRPGEGGCYVRYPTDELFALTCLEAWRRGAVLVGENLGTVPPEVHDALHRHRLLGIWVQQAFWWGLVTGGFEPAPAASVASFATHDMPTFAGFWRGADIEDRRDLRLVDDVAAAAEHEARQGLLRAARGYLGVAGDASREETFVASVGELADGAAELAVLNAEDLWFEERPQNVPGTLHERPNWKRVAALPLEAWDEAPATAEALARLASRSHRDSGGGAEIS